MSIFVMPTKASAEILDYQIDMTAELAGRNTGGANDRISTVIWTVPAGITSIAQTSDASTVTIWLSGGTNGAFYVISAGMTTTGGREYTRAFGLYIDKR